MRELKFRAWDKKTNQMVQLKSIHFYGSPSLSYVSWMDLINKTEVSRDFNEVEIMQYTGLKDRNGREIYEKDIIQFKQIERNGFHCAGGSYAVKDEIVYRAEVKFYKGSFFLSGWYYPGTIHLHQIILKDDCLFGIHVHEKQIGGYDNAFYTDFEVIGNIYENPDLHEQK